jgi:hypothetical protein
MGILDATPISGVFMIDLLAVQSSTAYPTLVTMIYTLLLAFVLSSSIGFTYEKTFLGLSYSRNFVQALVLSSVVAATVMQAIGDNVGRGLGMLGALSIVRFRTSFKDPRDIMFLFAALGAGIGCGVFAWGVAAGGTLVFCIIAFILSRSGLEAKIFLMVCCALLCPMNRMRVLLWKKPCGRTSKRLFCHYERSGWGCPCRLCLSDSFA